MFWEKDISLKTAGKRKNEEPNTSNEEILQIAEMRIEKKKSTVKPKQNSEETEHVVEKNFRVDQELEKLESKLKCYLRYKTIFCHKVALNV